MIYQKQYHIENFLTLVKKLFPKECIFCNKIVFGSPYCICAPCIQNLDQYKLKNLTENVLSVYEYRNEIRDIVLKMKYHSQNNLTIIIAHLIFYNFKKFLTPYDFDYIVPVPGSFQKAKKNLFYPVIEISIHLSFLTGIKNLPFILKKSGSSVSQTELSLNQRKTSIENKIIINTLKANQIRKKRILLIDDVITTGSTLKESQKELLKYDPLSIKVITFARTAKKAYDSIPFLASTPSL